MENKLILGDNLQVLKSLPSESVDLIYLDPPFFSNRNYEVIWGDEGEVRSFKDRWEGGINHYISWLKERVVEMHRILKKTGSIYLHCDWHADVYIRVHILDPIFGEKNFRNNIVWRRGNSHNDGKRFGNITDSIFFYTKTNDYIFEKQFTDHNEDSLLKEYPYICELTNKRYKSVSMNASGKGEGRFFGDIFLEPPKGTHWRWSQDRITKALQEGIIFFSKNGVPRYKQYADNINGKQIQNIWTDFMALSSQAKERIGYPTQKPEALLERIIKASSNEGDIVLDPFVGGGTTPAVADKLGRRWIGVDSSVHAIKVSEQRIKNNQIKSGERSTEKGQDSLIFKEKPFEVKLHKYDYEEIRNMNDRKFEFFIIEAFEAGSKVNANPNKYYVDGYTKALNIPIQVKRQDGVGKKIVDNMITASRMEDKERFENLLKKGEPVGIIIAFSFAQTTFDRVAELKMKGEGLIKLVKVEDVIPLKQKPKLELEFEDGGVSEKGERVLRFFAKTSEVCEFFQWDFAFKEEVGFNAGVMMDREGKTEFSFAKGEHSICCKAVDGDGIEKQEVMRLVVNGAVKRV